MEYKKYIFYWLTGNKEILEGISPEDALNNAGYGGGSLSALDFYSININEEYVWDKKSRTWIQS